MERGLGEDVAHWLVTRHPFSSQEMVLLMKKCVRFSLCQTHMSSPHLS